MVKAIMLLSTTARSSLYFSIQRFFKYVLKIELTLAESEISNFRGADICLLVNNDQDEFMRGCRLLYSNKFNPKNIRTLGSNNHSDVNLLDYKNLKSNIISCINSSFSLKKKDYVWLSGIITTFFKGHGEQSLLSCIGRVNYYLKNYSNMVKEGGYDPVELNKTFLEPGMQNWGEFVRRFVKHAPLLYFMKWDKETLYIERRIYIVEKTLKNIKVTDSFYIFGNVTFKSLSGITDTLERMANEWTHYNEKAQPADS